LYTYLIENNFDAEFKVYSRDFAHLEKFNCCINESGVGECFKSDRCLSFDEKLTWSGVTVTGYSDVGSYLQNRSERTIIIDHSILKNCVKPTTKEKKSELRKKYNIQEDKPVVVVGFGGFCFPSSLESIVRSLRKYNSVYLVGSVGVNLDLVDAKFRVNSEGVLKDYYALADVAMISKNTYLNVSCESPLHNFVEATAGGPLFLVKPINTAQYGYRQLVQREVIREAQSADDLIAKIKKYLENPEEEKVRAQRTQHLNSSRDLYLPEISRLLNRVINESQEYFQSDLLAETLPPTKSWFFKKYSSKIAIGHPETKWDFDRVDSNKKSMNEIHPKIYKAFRRRK
jgi:DNA-binding transcriptional MerR regulator